MIRTPIVVFLLAIAWTMMPSSRAESPSARDDSLELVIVSEEKLVRLELRVEVDGRSIPAIWEETFDKLFAYYDRNSDGSIDEKEAAKLPSPFSLRQLLWGQSVPYSGRPPVWKELDTNRDGKLTKPELADYYKRGGLGHVLVGVGRTQSSATLTTSLLKALDTDGNDVISEAEWKAAPDALRKLDRNDDELIGPGELVPKTAYPGTVGAILLSPPSANEKTVPELEGLPLIVLPADSADTYWASVVVNRRDQNNNGKLDAKEVGLAVDVFKSLDTDRDRKISAEELAAWRKERPTARYTIRLGKRSKDQASLERPPVPFGTSSLHLDVRFDEGKMPEMVETARRRFLDCFTDADANAEGYVEEKEIAKRNQAELKQLLLVADRDADGKLSQAELVAWLDLQDQVAAGLVLLTVLDHGAGLFELLDANYDGSLSVPELRQAWDRIKKADCLTTEGKFDSVKLPRHLVLTASRGHPLNTLGSSRQGGPTWFRAMDRNGDGYVSRREFTGVVDVFDKLDRDKDGFISPEETEKAAKLEVPRK